MAGLISKGAYEKYKDAQEVTKEEMKELTPKPMGVKTMPDEVEEEEEKTEPADLPDEKPINPENPTGEEALINKIYADGFNAGFTTCAKMAFDAMIKNGGDK